MKRQLRLRSEYWKARAPFRISGRTWSGFDLLVCELQEDGITGRGEAAGVFYLDETAESIHDQIATVADAVEAGVDRQALQQLLPPGGARNALDCALWDIEARRGGTNAWTLAGVGSRAVTTVYTIGLESTPAEMAAKARAAADRPLLKIKLNADRPVERVRAIREARPDARLIADANGGWTHEQLRKWAPQLAGQLSLLEQPLPRGGDAELESYDSPVPLFADESCLHLGEVELAARRYDGIVMKLDKTGGLTEALQLASAARKRDLRLMVGCMVATSLSMAPAHVLAQICEFVDIDGPLLLTHDRPHGLHYDKSSVTVPGSILWGAATGNSEAPAA